MVEIGEKYNKTAAQVNLQFLFRSGVVVIPKSTHKERIEENFAIWDFTLTDEEMKKISLLDMGYGDSRTKHFDPEFVRGILKVKNS